MKNRQKLRHGIILFSFFLFPAVYYYLSPYLIIDASGKGVINGSFLVFFVLFVSALFMGRTYCGWVCPAAGCQEALFRSRNKRVTKGNFVKWIIWIPWIAVILLLAIKNGYHKIDFFYQTTYGLSIADVYGFVTYLFILFLIVLPALIIGKRSFCHHICWIAPFMILGRKIRNGFRWPALHLKADNPKCIHCHTCTENCPMSLPVESLVEKDRMENSECILCGSCVDGCESQVIRFAYKNEQVQ